MKRLLPKILLLLLATISGPLSKGQSSGTITVGGDFDKFYPVTWRDNNWANGLPTELHISRVDINEDSHQRGSLMSVFRFHANRWGHGSDYINAQIYHSVVPFVAGWKDAALQNNGQRIIIWLRGGGTTYSYWSAVSVDPVVYDGVQESLPYNEPGGPSHSYKTTLDDYVNSMGVSTGDLLAGSIISTGNINVGANQVQFLSAAGGNNRIQSFGGGGPYGTWLFKSRFDHMVFDAGKIQVMSEV